jgi:hypothetical protein
MLIISQADFHFLRGVFLLLASDFFPAGKYFENRLPEEVAVTFSQSHTYSRNATSADRIGEYFIFCGRAQKSPFIASAQSFARSKSLLGHDRCFTLTTSFA